MKRWIKILLTSIMFIGLTVAMYFIGFEGEWIKPIVEGAGVFGYIIYILIQVVITTIMCFVPATTFTFTLMASQLFGVWTGFAISAIACWLSSMVMFTIGDKLGEPFIDWLIGKESRIKAQNLISTRATILTPIMLACPFFPDDAICMVAGVTKMKYWYFAIVAAFTRTLGVAVTSFIGGSAELFNLASFRLIDWVFLINFAIIDVLLIWKGSAKLEQIIKNKKAKKIKGENDDNNMSTL